MIYFWGGLLSALCMTWLALILCRRYGISDIPNERSSHVQITPRGGGVGIYVPVLIAVTVLFFRGEIDGALSRALLWGGGLVVAVGLLDDLRGLPVLVRLPIHMGAAGLASFVILQPTLSRSAPVTDVLIIVAGTLFLAWSLNIYNFMDGIDGIAGVQGAFAGIAMLLSRGTFGVHGVNLLGLCLSGACLGFLVSNWPPAKIFMGDAGSGFLGFLIGCVALACAVRSFSFLYTWLVILGVFAVDSSVTLMVRIWRGERFYVAHRQHAYQHLARRLESHGKVTGGIVVICLVWLLPLAWLSILWKKEAMWILFAALTPLLGLALAFHAGREWSPKQIPMEVPSRLQ